MSMLTMPATARLLGNDDGFPLWFMVVEEATEHDALGRIYAVSAWRSDGTPQPVDVERGFEEVAVLSLKWDGCAHVGLRSVDLGKEWVHVCGAAEMEATLRMLREAWRVLQESIATYDPDEKLPDTQPAS